MDRNHVAPVFNTFGDEGLRPWDIPDHSIMSARAQACGEHEHVVLALKTRPDHHGEVTALLARLVDGNGNRYQPRQVHQQVVNQVAEVPIVLSSNDSSECHAILSAERVVRDEGVEPPVVLRRKVLTAYDVERGVKVAYAVHQPVCSAQMSAFPKVGVHLVLMRYALEPCHQRPWHELRLRTHFDLHNVFNVNCFLCDGCHFFFCIARLSGGAVFLPVDTNKLQK